MHYTRKNEKCVCQLNNLKRGDKDLRVNAVMIIKSILETVSNGNNWLLLAHDRDQLQALEHMPANFFSSIKGSSPSS
jgi:hypothetical protein